MAISSLLYKLASPYDAYVSHVSELNSALAKLRYMSERALGYEAGLHGAVRLLHGGAARSSPTSAAAKRPTSKPTAPAPSTA